MKQLMSLPLEAEFLSHAPGLSETCSALGCDGLEVVWSGDDLQTRVPQPLRVGYHLTFWPDWLDFWNGDEAALLSKFGSPAAWTDFFGGPAGRDTLLNAYRADLERAVAWGAAYVVFHVSDVSLEEGYTYQWLHTNEAVIDAAAEAVNLLLDGRAWPFVFLVENQWWPGFTFTNPMQTSRLLNAIHYENKGIMLDVGHLLNTNLDLTSEAEGVAYLHKMLEEHGDLCRLIRGIHLHQSLSGAYVKAHTGSLPEGWADEPDYLKRFSESYRHILRMDTHAPWHDSAIVSVIDRIGPEYLVHELSGVDCAQRLERLRVQTETLRKGWMAR